MPLLLARRRALCGGLPQCDGRGHSAGGAGDLPAPNAHGGNPGAEAGRVGGAAAMSRGAQRGRDDGMRKTMAALMGCMLAAALWLPASAMAGPGGAGGLDVETLALDNGLQVYLAPRGEVPVLTLEAMVVAGTMDEPAGSAGLAYFVGELLNRGTENYTARELANKLDSMGAELSVDTDYDYTTVSLSILSKDLEEGLELLREVLDRAAFDPEEVERKRSEVQGYLERLKDDYVDVVRKTFYDLIYGEHPYHRPLQGTMESVSELGADDLREFHAATYVPNNIMLAAVGQFDSGLMAAEIRDTFGDWARRDVAPREPPEMPEPHWQVKTIDREVTQATIRLGHIGLPRDHPDYNTARLLNFILGGSGFGSRLMANLREDRGITYGVYSNFWPRKDAGYFFVSTQVVLDSLNVAVREILAEIDEIRAEGITAEELELAKRYYTGNLPLQLQTNEQLAGLVLQQQFYGLEDDFWLKEIEAMQAATLDDVHRVAREHISPQELALVVLGDFEKVSLAYDKSEAPGS
ncbi:MAG: hypothetical protein GF355_09165 [Candidatus Eisenbacteria bacterium]|nr:hypothetical protein [Candidatus Eisenbacteria bacterium]